jgi:hypothetical protein
MGYKGLYAFNDRGKIENVIGTKIFDIHQKAWSGKPLTREEKDYVFQHIVSNTYSKRGVPLLGIMFDFSPYLKRFIVKDRYGGIEERYAFDKSNIRNSFYTNQGLAEIIEIPKK